jgi:hypothetical protein
MSKLNGDRARFDRREKKKLKQRDRSRKLRQDLESKPAATTAPLPAIDDGKAEASDAV